jgi:hypothetical protein
MNCEKCQDLIHDLLDGTISRQDEVLLNTHLRECLDCESVRDDLSSIVDYSRTQRGVYDAPPNSQAMWLRIRNVVEAENITLRSEVKTGTQTRSWFANLFGKSWELSFPQLAAFTAAVMLCVSLVTVVGVRRLGNNPQTSTEPARLEASNINERVWKQQQVINYWNQRVEVNKARWSPEMREVFDRNLQVIDQAVSQSLNELNRNPHDEISEQMLNESLNDKLALLKEFSDL